MLARAYQHGRGDRCGILGRVDPAAENLSSLVDDIDRACTRTAQGRAAVVAISGIDASGKGTLAAKVARAMEGRRRRVALVGLDPWHQPRHIRFSERDPAPHFYANAFRFEALFESLVEPLRSCRSVRTVARLVDLTTDEEYEREFDFDGVDLVLIEGIFLLKRELVPRYDLRIWVECSFEAALARARARNQEGLADDALVHDYERTYFPAQRLHLRRDEPRAAADAIHDNN